jgi:uncharacterized protein
VSTNNAVDDSAHYQKLREEIEAELEETFSSTFAAKLKNTKAALEKKHSAETAELKAELEELTKQQSKAEENTAPLTKQHSQDSEELTKQHSKVVDELIEKHSKALQDAASSGEKATAAAVAAAVSEQSRLKDGELSAAKCQYAEQLAALKKEKVHLQLCVFMHFS